MTRITESGIQKSCGVESILRDPFEGIGNLEPLTFLGSDIWSRRLTQEHRCVYVVKSDRVDFLQGRYHD
jgi:toxin YoeB